jgi:hypothetical protein
VVELRLCNSGILPHLPLVDREHEDERLARKGKVLHQHEAVHGQDKEERRSQNAVPRVLLELLHLRPPVLPPAAAADQPFSLFERDDRVAEGRSHLWPHCTLVAAAVSLDQSEVSVI